MRPLDQKLNEIIKIVKKKIDTIEVVEIALPILFVATALLWIRCFYLLLNTTAQFI